MIRRISGSGGLVACLAVLALAAPALGSPGDTQRVSVASDGHQSNDQSDRPSVSGDGRYVAFESPATNLVAGDTNGAYDVFVRDRQAGVTERVSVASDGTQGNGSSFLASISSDGRYVAFVSGASNLVAGDTDGNTDGGSDVFVHDRQTGVTERVSVATNGTQSGGLDVGEVSISGDGRYVAFATDAQQLVAGDTNDRRDVFVHDRQSGVTQRVSVASDGTQAAGWSSSPAISADGRYVAFRSYASNLVADDTNKAQDVFVHDLQTGATERVSLTSAGKQANLESWTPSISADGRYVAFTSTSSNLASGTSAGRPNVFLRDRQAGTTTNVSVALGGANPTFHGSAGAAVSADGRYVAFYSTATNLVAGDSNSRDDVFVRDVQKRVTVLADVASDGTQANSQPASYPAISADGRFVAFASYASNLVAGDTNGKIDVFVNELGAAPSFISTATARFTQGTAGSFTVKATGWPAPSLAIEGSLPAGLTFTDNGDHTGTLSGTPAAGTAGTHTVTVTASNTVGAATQTLTIVVRKAP